MNEGLYSIRMRASRDGMHISGAERIIGESDIPQVTNELLIRANTHERGRPDSVTVTLDSLDGKELLHFSALPIKTLKAETPDKGMALAIKELLSAGVSEIAANSALDALASGASPSGGSMRGAMIVDALTGRRLEQDPAKGVRARAVDYAEPFRQELENALEAKGLNITQLKEALALATKVSNAPGAVAELCISDDPSYVTGYVASLRNGYVRITPLKEAGDYMGGRAFFVDGSIFDLDGFGNYLKKTPVLVESPVSFTDNT